MKQDLHKVAAELAAKLELGTVGIAGAYALGIATAESALEVFVACRLNTPDAERYGHELAELAGVLVVLHDVERLPWSSPLHASVCWVNVDRLPQVPCPKGAKSRIAAPGGAVAVVQLDTLAHFFGVPGYVDTPPGRASRAFRAPVGGFLL